MTIPVIIPAYEPDARLLGLIDELNKSGLGPVIVVNDGSEGAEYKEIFEGASQRGARLLTHAVNMGKGRALKDAFNYCLNEYDDLLGIITADSDGQHTAEDIRKCLEALSKACKESKAKSGIDSIEDECNGEVLVLGVRDFNESGIPARSVFGNKTTSRVMKLLLGLSISDTQTGLRGISVPFMKYLLTENGERFEFETNMLIATKELGIKIVEVPIKTIYLEENKSSHFNPILDSIRIYAVFVKFLFSSLSSSVVDIVMFSIFCGMFRNVPVAIGYVMLATILARVISAIYNFIVNYKVVFKGKGSKSRAALKYLVLAICIMLLSGGLVTFFTGLLPMVPEFVVKIPVDCVLFLLSFVVQREIVYK
jgi:glycosyltransferase involved in cell wall biosynthesis